MTGSPPENTTPISYRQLQRTLLCMVFVDVVILIPAVWLAAGRTVPPLTALAVVFLLFLGNVAFIRWKLPRRRPIVGVRVSKFDWFVLALFGASAVIWLVNLVGKRSWFHAAQAVGAVALAVWVWWIIRTARKVQRDARAAAPQHDVQP